MRSAAPVLVVLAALVGCARQAEPSPAPASPLEVLGHHPRISMARIRLGPSETFTVAANRCQEVLFFVEQGAARVATHWIPQSRAARLSAPALVQAPADARLEMFAVAVLSDAAAASAVNWHNAPSDDACPQRAEAIIESDPTRSGPFIHADGRLSVMIYLDAAPGGPPVASLGTLEAGSALGVPEHAHESSSEALWIQRGSGTMRVGNETRVIREGTFVYVPPQTLHGFVPDGTQPLFAYQVYTPSGPEQRFR